MRLLKLFRVVPTKMAVAPAAGELTRCWGLSDSSGVSVMRMKSAGLGVAVVVVWLVVLVGSGGEITMDGGGVGWTVAVVAGSDGSDMVLIQWERRCETSETMGSGRVNYESCEQVYTIRAGEWLRRIQAR